MTEWGSDILGDGFEAKKLKLAPDEEGPVSATLVRALPKPADQPPNLQHSNLQPQSEQTWTNKIGRQFNRAESFIAKLFGRGKNSHDPLRANDLRRDTEFAGIDVLYVHGWSDYFFQTELADFWTSKGARFFALDLRKYGRSLHEHQTPGYIEDLEDYDEEIELALAEIKNTAPQIPQNGLPRETMAATAQESGNNNADPAARKLVLLGHSTGGLTLSLWAARNQDRFDALILNSPWLEFQLSAAARKAFAPLVELTAKFAASEPVPQIDFGYYTRAQHEVAEAADYALEVNEHWRPEKSMPVRPGWFRAIITGQEKLSHKLRIEKPVLVLLSDDFELSAKWDEKLKHVDSVLNVENVAVASLKLGSNVTIMRVKNALHDVFLSIPTAREKAYENMREWMVGILAAKKE